MAHISIDTTQNVTLDVELASLGDRIVAYIIDILIRYAYLIVLFVFASIGAELWAANSVEFVTILVVIAVLVPFIFYHLLFEIFNHGQSPGKRVMQIRVARVDGDQVGVGSYILRWLLRLVDINLLSGIVAIISIGVSEKNQRLGDMVAGTTVVKERREFSLGRLAYTEPAKVDYAVTYPQVIRLKSSHIELIKDALDNSEIADINDHIVILADKIATIMGVQFSEHPRKFLRTITKDHTHVHRHLT